jgi:MoaA/NifB/PqqE/SkfB family radical SAM enzyme
MSDDDKRALFRRNVTLVELEPHAFCNRTCAFCPNSTIDRLTVKTTLDRELFGSILRDLASIDYRHLVRFARYSEPMAHEHIFEMVAMVRRALPRAAVDIVTNGDYLKPDSVRRLRDAGLSVLRVSVYMPPRVAWSVAGARETIARVAKRAGLEPVWDVTTETSVGATFPYDGMPIVAFSHNFDEIGYDRGQLVSTLVDREYVRRSPCFLVFSNFTVDFDGKVMPCCNLRGDHPQHQAFVLGDLARRQSIFDVYAGPRFAEWRRGLATVGAKGYPCATCKQKVLDGPRLAEIGRAVDAKLRAIGVTVPPS